MTADILLAILLTTAALVAAGLGALILAAFGPTGWFVVAALVVTGALAQRFAAAPADWRNEDLRDDWRAG
jgi:hypothetical protein